MIQQFQHLQDSDNWNKMIVQDEPIFKDDISRNNRDKATCKQR